MVKSIEAKKKTQVSPLAKVPKLVAPEFWTFRKDAEWEKTLDFLVEKYPAETRMFLGGQATFTRWEFFGKNGGEVIHIRWKDVDHPIILEADGLFLQYQDMESLKHLSRSILKSAKGMTRSCLIHDMHLTSILYSVRGQPMRSFSYDCGDLPYKYSARTKYMELSEAPKAPRTALGILGQVVGEYERLGRPWPFNEALSMLCE